MRIEQERRQFLENRSGRVLCNLSFDGTPTSYPIFLGFAMPARPDGPDRQHRDGVVQAMRDYFSTSKRQKKTSKRQVNREKWLFNVKSGQNA
jgi:hypothetical protein